MKNLKLVIFDLDGVLVDACEWHYVALNKALKQVSNYQISPEDHESTFNGIPTREKLRILTDMKKISEDDHNKIYEIKQSITKETIKKYSTIIKNNEAVTKMDNDIMEGNPEKEMLKRTF